ncbi:flagellar motor protein MotB [Alterisphingorhabdus coralli]|uniref:Flagellar motor protein MotB n=1 Tax=Alterisphingorhabdus coralli TaxID=3071408 RepID=A0AA97F808_9SPHN|nr:flagellar motor protein MotB [Parasphingorhabdus sp. SCSIO 66989]WOE74742.1 flagellar motor protein MotB [Parasphingorhabdus sp. SCSIO 66989]
MAAAKSAKKDNQRPIIVKKIIADDHDGHHGGAWKVAYADFVTAMMAFFLLMWLLGATDEKQRKALADYFTPTLVELKQGSAGSNGVFGGESIVARDDYPHAIGQTGDRSLTIPKDATGVEDRGGRSKRSLQKVAFEALREELEQRLNKRPDLVQLSNNVRFTHTREGLRIDLVDEADFAMFSLATDNLSPRAKLLLEEVADVVTTLSNPVIVRGHTDSLPYASGKVMNNWMLSTARAEATRKALVDGGVEVSRMHRIEGVADREPFNAADPADPRNRRMSITLVYMDGQSRADIEMAKRGIADENVPES